MVAEVMPQFRVCRRHDKLWHLSVFKWVHVFNYSPFCFNDRQNACLLSLSMTVIHVYLLPNTTRDLKRENTSHFNLWWRVLKTVHSHILVTMPQFTTCHSFTLRVEAISPPLVGLVQMKSEKSLCNRSMRVWAATPVNAKGLIRCMHFLLALLSSFFLHHHNSTWKVIGEVTKFCSAVKSKKIKLREIHGGVRI